MMNKTSKSSGSSRPVALKSTNAKPTKVEKIVTFTIDPADEEELRQKQRRNLATFLRSVDEQASNEGLPPARRGRKKGLRTNFYPPVPIDAPTLEWFASRTGSRMSMAFAINHVLMDYIDAWEREQAKKAG